MSFVVNVMENDTLKYWSNKLKGKWYKYPFLLSKNMEIDSFHSAFAYEINNVVQYSGITEFPITNKKNSINIDSKIAIVVPIYVSNKKTVKQIERLIKSIDKLKRKPDFVFLIDDCSPRTYQSYGHKVIKLETNGGPARARNVGIDMAIELEADIIAFTDSDVILPTNWTEKIIEGFIKNREFQVLSGKTVSYHKTWYDLYHNINGTLNGRKFKNSKQLLYGPTCNLAIEAKVIKNIRFSLEFPLAAGEDIEFCFRLLKNENNIGHYHEMAVYHDFEYKYFGFKKNKQSFIKQFVKYAKGEKVLLKLIPEYYFYLNETNEISNTRRYKDVSYNWKWV